MIEKDYSNMFRFSLKQGDNILCETMFDADKFNPFTRYSIDVRDILPRIITTLQKTLSKKVYDVEIDVGFDINNEIVSYDLYDYYQKDIQSFPKGWQWELYYKPKPKKFNVKYFNESKTIKGVPCKMGFYINNNPIVEREFFVDGFNPVSKQSVDILDVVSTITETIERRIYLNDIKNMWDDYDLINLMGLSINQIRELHPISRVNLLRKLKRD